MTPQSSESSRLEHFKSPLKETKYKCPNHIFYKSKNRFSPKDFCKIFIHNYFYVDCSLFSLPPMAPLHAKFKTKIQKWGGFMEDFVCSFVCCFVLSGRLFGLCCNALLCTVVWQLPDSIQMNAHGCAQENHLDKQVVARHWPTAISLYCPWLYTMGSPGISLAYLKRSSALPLPHL